MRTLRRTIGWLAASMLLVVLLFMLWATAKGRPQDLPWTPLDLGEPIGMFTGRKLTALTADAGQCRALLDRAGVRYVALPAVRAGPNCGYADGVRFMPGGARRIRFAPTSPNIACPVAAALSMWEWTIVQPAAQRHFGQRVAAIDHLGSYNCRRIVGSESRSWSEHASADAVDIAGFRLADGTRITILGDWKRRDETAAFLREVRNGACRLFATTLSPDYNAAHRDHLHLDQANRGAIGWRACR